MRTFGVALRVLPGPSGEPVGSVFDSALGEWGTAKAKDKRAVAAGFAVTSRKEARQHGSLTEYSSEQAAEEEGKWRTTTRLFQSEGDAAWLTIEMALDDIAERFAPASFKVQPPRFLRDLGKHLTLKSVDGWEVPKDALAVGSTDTVNLLADEILDPNRIIPLVVVTEPVFAKPRVSALGRALAEHVFGLARVVQVSRAMTYTLTERLGKELSVFDGGVRIYWPGVKVDSSPQRHPLFLRRFMEDAGASAKRRILDAVAQQLIVVATARYREPPPLREFLRKVGAEALDAAALSSAALTAQLEAASRARDEAKELEEIALSENRSLQVEKAALEAALEQARREATRWKVAFDGLRAKHDGSVEDLPPPPEDEVDALKQARIDFAKTLVLPEDMVLDTDLGAGLYDALGAMSEAVERERSGKMGDRQAAFAELFGKHLNHPARYEPGPTGLTYRHNGKKEVVRDRVHLKSGKPDDTESIYWIAIGEVGKRQFVIVRVGRHA